MPRIALAALVLFAGLSGIGAARAASVDPAVDVRRGMEATFSVAIVDGRIMLGPPRISRLGTTRPQDGEVTIGVESGGMAPYAKLRVSEKTSAPFDFVATGFIDRIKIDEVVVCGRLDMPLAERIAAGSLRVSLSRFAVGTGVDTCK